MSYYEFVKKFKGHLDKVTCIKYVSSNSNGIIISGCNYGQIKIWSVDSGECIKTINEHFDSISGILIISNKNQFLRFYFYQYYSRISGV